MTIDLVDSRLEYSVPCCKPVRSLCTGRRILNLILFSFASQHVITCSLLLSSGVCIWYCVAQPMYGLLISLSMHPCALSQVHFVQPNCHGCQSWASSIALLHLSRKEVLQGCWKRSVWTKTNCSSMAISLSTCQHIFPESTQFGWTCHLGQWQIFRHEWVAVTDLSLPHYWAVYIFMHQWCLLNVKYALTTFVGTK